MENKKGSSFVIVFFFLCFLQINAQGIRKPLNWLVYHSVIDTTAAGKPSFRIYPTLAYSPETALEIGVSTLFIYNAKEDTANRLSEINAFTFVTLENQYGIWLDNALYTDKDKWFFLGRSRFQRFPLLYYGLGANAPADYPARIDANYFLFRQRALRRLAPNLFLGPEIDYQHLYNTGFIIDEAGLSPEPPLGVGGSANLGLGAAIVYDNRHNVLNVRKGYFAELGFLGYSSFLGSDYRFNGINVDVRGYHPIQRSNVLAWQFIGNFLHGEVPFNQMALIGGETMMRGYYYGRYRDRNLLAGQLEFRMLPFAFSKRLGGTLFAGSASVAPAVRDFRLRDFKLSGGAGLRYLLFPKKDIFVRFDVGVTREGVGFYFFTGEAF